MRQSNAGTVRLLGPLHVEKAGQAVSVPGGKAASLFALLCLQNNRAYARELLIERLWPEYAPAAARRALSDSLYRLRNSAVGEWLQVSGEQIGLVDQERLWIDVPLFEAYADRPEDAALALDLYRGDLLEGMFDDWLLAPRYALRERYLDLLHQVATYSAAGGNFVAARQTFKRLLAEDPLDERAYVGQMQALAQEGRPGEALAVYARLVAVMEEEFGVEPGPEGRQLAARLRAEQRFVPKADSHSSYAAPFDPLHPPFAGRREERRLLLGAVEAAIGGMGQLVAVEGPAGIGKSRLLEEVADSARWRGATVTQGAAGDRPSASPFSALAQAATAILSGLRATQIAAQLPPATLAAFGPLYQPWRTLAELPNLPPEAARQRLHSAAIAVFAALCALTPSVLILDDMHWATQDQWAILNALAAHCERMPLLLLIGYRRRAVENGPGWDALRRWESNGWLTPCPLAPLGPEEVAAMLPPQFRSDAAEIYAISGGNPYFITETLMGLERDRRPYRLTIEQRLDRLRPEDRAALQAAAVAGDGASYPFWQAVAGRTSAEMAGSSSRLAAAFLLQVTDEGCRFPHDLIRNAVYDQLAPDERRLLHGRAAAALSEKRDVLPLRAFHLAAAGERESAGQAYRMVADAALASFAYSDAQRALTRALELAPPPTPDELLTLILKLARTCAITGDRTAQQAALDATRPLLADSSAEIRLQALIERAHFAFLTGDQSAAGALLDEAEALAAATKNEAALCAVYLQRGDVDMHFGRNQAAVVALEEALALARQRNDRAHEGRALDGLAWAYSNLNEPIERCLPLYEQAIEAQVAAGNEFEAARARLNYLSALQDIGAWDRAAALADVTLAAQQRTGYIRGEGAARQARGLIALALGDYEQAEREAAAACAIFDDIGERLGYVIATVTLGNVRHRIGDAEGAEARLLEAQTEAQALGSPLFEAFALQDLGIQYYEKGRIAEAIPRLEQAAANWRETGERLNRYQCETYLALCRLASGDEARAGALAEAVWQAFERDRVAGETPQNWYWALAQLLEQLGRTEQYASALHAAFDELQTQSRAIVDHAVRRRFYTAVPINRTIVAAHDRLAGTLRRSTVTLARADAPLGRPLLPDETLAVSWTLFGPEDEAIEDKTERRRYRLAQLMAEAAAQNAAPTDQDLAHALGVSRRTILRDLAALEARGEPVFTRGRGGRGEGKVQG
jgi:DNA-binding SARP family transcriptional activator/biotin operon repressor